MREVSQQQYMPSGEPVLYRESLVSHGAIGAVATAGIALASAGLTIGVAAGIYGGPSAAALALPIFGVGASMAGVGILSASSQVIVASRWVHVHFGLLRRTIPVSGIHQVRVVDHATKRHGKVETDLDGTTRTYVARAKSKRGVEIAYYDKNRSHVIVVGSEEPERFAYAIEQARRAGG